MLLRPSWPALFLIWLLGCADDAECPQLELCDITDASCQQAIMTTVRCMRGGNAALPTVRLVSESELLMRFSGEDTRSEEDRRLSQRWNDGLSLLRLAPPRYDSGQALKDAVSQYAAVYLGDTREILVVDRGESLASAEAVQLFAHELTHALQDAEHGLRAWRERWVFDLDSALSSDAVVEGEAVFYELMVSLQTQHTAPSEVDWEAYFTRWRRRQLDLAELDPAPVTMADVRFPYAFGGGYVMQQWLSGGRPAIRALWEQPPATTREVMFGRFATDAARSQQLTTRSLPQPGAGYTLIGASKLGAWITRQLVARMQVPVAERLLAAEVLDYDLFSVQENVSSGELLAGWHLAFSEPRSIPFFDPALDRRMEGDREWFLLASEPRRALDTLAWGPPSSAPQALSEQTASVPWAPPLRHAGCARPAPRPDASR